MSYERFRNETDGFKLWSYTVHGAITLPLSFFGVIFNIITIAIFLQKSMRSLTNTILLGISAFDIILMVAYMPYATYFYLLNTPDPIPGQNAFWPYYALINVHVMLFAHGCSVWFACFLASYRYLTVSSCVNRKSFNPKFNETKVRNIMIGIILMILSCMTMNVICYDATESCHDFIEIDGKNDGMKYNVCEIENQTQNYSINENILNTTAEKDNRIVSLKLLWLTESKRAVENPIIKEINFWIHGIVFRSVPCLLLLVLSGLLIYIMRIANTNRLKLMQQGRRSEYEKAGEFNRTTTMLLILVISFLIMELPHGILHMICAFRQSFFDDVYVHLGDLLDLLVLINSSINFFLYCCMSSQFRNKFKEMFCSVFSNKKTNVIDKQQNQSKFVEISQVNLDPSKSPAKNLIRTMTNHIYNLNNTKSTNSLKTTSLHKINSHQNFHLNGENKPFLET
jgi:hypothetical protein